MDDKPPILNYAGPETPPKGALLTIFFVVLVDMLGFGLIVPLLPFYADSFKANATQVGWLFAIFSICQFVATPTLGSLSDRVGRRPVLMISQFGNAMSYVLLAWASRHQFTDLTLGLLTLYLSRIVAGLTSGNISAASAYISDVTTPANRTKGMGALGAAFGFGFALGPALGGKMAHYISPDAPAWLAAALSLVSATMCFSLLKESVRRSSTRSSNYLNPRQFFPLFHNKPLMKINATWFIAMVAFVAVDSMIVLFLNRAMGYDPGQVANYLLMIGVVILLTQGVLVGRLQRRYSEWSLCISGVLINGIGTFLTACLVLWPSLWLIAISGIVAAFGRSLFQPTISALVSHHSDEKEQGLSFGFFQGVGTLGRIIGPAIAGPLFQIHITWPWFFSGATLGITGLWLARLRFAESRETRS